MFALPKPRLRLLTQIVLLISFVVFASMALAGTLFAFMIDGAVTHYIGQNALNVARLTAMDERIVNAYGDADPSAVIQPVAERIRRETGASYVVVGSREGIRYSHTNPELIGREMQGGDNAPVLAGGSIISEAVGASGPSLRGKTPVLNERGEVIGIVSAGFLSGDIRTLVRGYERTIAGLSAGLLAVGMLGAYLTARRVKKLIFGLEPGEIAFMFKEKEATIEAIRDAIVAVNGQGTVVTMNRRARELLQVHGLAAGSRLTHLPLLQALREVAESRRGYSDHRVFLDSEVYALHAEPILNEERAEGAVFTFHTEIEIERLTDEFSKIRAFSDNMRAQNHEYLNTLNTISGLLALGHIDQAAEMISGEVSDRQDVIAFLVGSVRDPLVAACLLGKSNRAKELKVQLEIDPDSQLAGVPEGLNSQSLVTVLGNLLDNAMEAAREHRGTAAHVRLSFTDLGHDLVFDIEDNGPGIPPGQEAAVFVSGYSTKPGGNRGLGLAIVKHALHAMHGQIYADRSELGGARFTVTVPKPVPAGPHLER
ncbi:MULTISPECIES: ATP-binding protein [Paenibacillus]|uniref:ATP-binding protein n=1 Tax=Paenibacillus TaxID=44249 RepID=UPI0022B8D26F|nr:sensor histidine kinase [Paenibacillus caseinilyticus]MCZ8520816.1 sensor histidine kinase [Paenibacillus caseinilyticus]